MRVSRPLTTRIVALVVFAFAFLSTLAAQSAPVEKQPMAEQVFTNVQVLKGIPVSEFMSTMGFFSASVGLNCVAHVLAEIPVAIDSRVCLHPCLPRQLHRPSSSLRRAVP